MVIYADTIFIINFIVNYLLGLVTAKICAVYVKRYRIVLAAVFGAAYAVFAVTDGTKILSNLFIKIAVGAVMLLITFGNKKPLWRIALVFSASAAGFAGIVMAISMLGGTDVMGGGLFVTPTFEVLLLAFAISYIVFSLIFKRSGRSQMKISEVTASVGRREIKFKALQDTGNSLSDPMTGKPVIVADLGTVSQIFSERTRYFLTKERLMNPVELFEKLNTAGRECRFHLVPYRAVGTDAGMLLAFTPDKIIIDGRENNSVIIAISPNVVSDGGAYSALIGAA